MGMQIPVLVERIEGNGYRARGFEPFAATAEGSTREEALHRLRETIKATLTENQEIVSLDLDAESNPWARIEGIYEGDPLFDEWQQAIADYRKQVDEEMGGR
jgi:predicted RNase H-like HicB family nuclease